MTSKVFILYTGGTFGMKPNKENGQGLVPCTWDEILDYMPTVKNQSYFQHFKNIEFSFHTLDKVVDSSDINPDIWKNIAKIIFDHYEDHSGFVIIHGTDTLAYTASALSFIFQYLAKPIVITGSQLPVFHPRTDALVNLSNAIYIAGYSAFELECIPEVCICFNDDILRGNRSVKTSTNDFEGFYSPNFEHLGWLEQSISINSNVLRPVLINERLEILTKFSNKVVNVTVFPGYDPSLLINLIQDRKVEGIVLKTFGSGNIPGALAWKHLVESCEKNDVLILATTQCPNGTIDIGKYEAGKILISDHVINGYDITSEAALTKLMWVIGNYPSSQRKNILSLDLRGEITKNKG